MVFENLGRELDEKTNLQTLNVGYDAISSCWLN